MYLETTELSIAVHILAQEEALIISDALSAMA